MAEATLNCPTCGGPLAPENRFVRMIVCQYCGNLCEVTDEGLTPAGSMGKLVPLPTLFQVGLTGKLRGRFFQVLGRVRYRYDEGMWDEWYLGLENGEAAWLEEDEGEWTLSQAQPLQGPAPTFEQARVGTRITVNGLTMLVTERVRAQVAGAEGQLYLSVSPGRAVNFVEGNIGGRTAYLEYSGGEVEFGIGETLQRSEVVLETGR